jgi:superfamily I DNA/RNA helicase
LIQNNGIEAVDFALLQQAATRIFADYNGAADVFKHIIIDEYQDTNSIQETIFFELSRGTKNICVVGDDDQSLYRLRGATVENLDEFEQRCKHYLGVPATRIDLDVNYRSREKIVDFYVNFMEQINWKKKGGTGHYRIIDKKITAWRKDETAAVIVSERAKADQVYEEIEEKLKEIFEENYELLKREGGHSLSEYVKQDAFHHVFFYFRKMRKMIDRISEAEVKLTLPEQRTKKGRRYAIEGVVDIIDESDCT